MAGLRKAKKYDWKDSNMALFGTDVDRKVKKASAETEKAWQVTTNLTGTHTVVFRINKFKVEIVPESEFGNFYDGDSYIVYRQTKKPDSDDFTQDIHFWIGAGSTQDEYGTAAYKTVELDNLHDDKPVQHREVQGKESALFKSYFPKICILKGGYDSGFRHVTTKEYKIRLLRVQKQPAVPGKKKNILINEVTAKKSNLNEDDVFVLDNGDKVVQINGSSCSADEKYRAREYIALLQNERTGMAMKLITRDSAEEAIEVPDEAADDDDDDEDVVDGPAEDFQATMFRLSDASGEMTFTEVQTGILTRDKLDPQDDGGQDVFICDFGTDCFVWVGKGASDKEKSNALMYAHNYLRGTQHQLCPIHVMKSGFESNDFLNRFH
ncbi:gelsolin-like protein 2 isoform X2 [Lineus longissimus]|uniref:gelsolin-like protein 2 isoform X2 n=1 Tax=Lineus longissimus TaxID=88925 RepID=UPI002B4F1681